MVNVQFNGQCSHFSINPVEPPKFGCQVVATAGLELPHDVEQAPVSERSGSTQKHRKNAEQLVV